LVEQPAAARDSRPYRSTVLARPLRRASSFMEAVMAIPDYARTNFQTLLRAAAAGHLALMECTDAASGVPRYVICAVGWQDGQHGGEYLMTPFGHLADGNPYELYIPPDASSGSAGDQPEGPPSQTPD
jgi:hypothetical protein